MKQDNKKDQEKKSSAYIDQSLHFHGNVSNSAITSHSERVRQKISSEAELNKIIELMAEAINADASLEEDEKDDPLKGESPVAEGSERNQHTSFWRTSKTNASGKRDGLYGLGGGRARAIWRATAGGLRVINWA